MTEIKPIKNNQAVKYALKLEVAEAESAAAFALAKVKLAESDYRDAQEIYCKAFLRYKEAMDKNDKNDKK